MLLAMGLASVLCIGIGVFPQPLYDLLPYPVDYVPYTTDHVLAQMQLLLFSALAFAVLQRTGLYPPELRSINLDTDWLYRRVPQLVWTNCGLPVATALQAFKEAMNERVTEWQVPLPQRWAVSHMVLLVVFLLFVFLVIDFWYQALPPQSSIFAQPASSLSK
jgi:multicomponent Na+:H+ antiporter subunit D